MNWVAGGLPEFPHATWDSDAFDAYRGLVGPTTEAPDAFLWAALAGVLSFLIGRDTWIDWGARREHPIVFPILVGETAKARKSTALHDAVDLVADHLRPRGNPADGLPDPSEIVRGSGSGEGFLEALADRPFRQRSDDGESQAKRRTEMQMGRRALFVVDEFAALLEKIERGQAGGMADFFLNLYDARNSWMHRVRSKVDVGTVKLTGATGIIMGATTLEWLVGVLSETHVRSGLMNRFLWFSGSRKSAIPRRPKIEEDAQVQLRDRISKLLGRVRGKPLRFSQAAEELYDRRYRTDYDAELPDLLAEATGRSAVQALRIAMLLAAADGRVVISEMRIPEDLGARSGVIWAAIPEDLGAIGAQRRLGPDRSEATSDGQAVGWSCAVSMPFFSRMDGPRRAMTCAL